MKIGAGLGSEKCHEKSVQRGVRFSRIAILNIFSVCECGSCSAGLPGFLGWNSSSEWVHCQGSVPVECLALFQTPSRTEVIPTRVPNFPVAARVASQEKLASVGSWKVQSENGPPPEQTGQHRDSGSERSAANSTGNANGVDHRPAVDFGQRQDDRKGSDRPGNECNYSRTELCHPCDAEACAGTENYHHE